MQDQTFKVNTDLKAVRRQALFASMEKRFGDKRISEAQLTAEEREFRRHIERTTGQKLPDPIRPGAVLGGIERRLRQTRENRKLA